MFEYVLIGVGLLLVAVSFFISEKVDDKLQGKENEESGGREIWSLKDEQIISKRLDEILSEKTEAAMIRVDDELSRISNEKIMAVSEFSDQLLEKMEQNHSEEVFLYNMLGEKEETVKKLVNTPIVQKSEDVQNTEVPEEFAEVFEEKKTTTAEKKNSDKPLSGLEIAKATGAKKSTRKKPAAKSKAKEEILMEDKTFFGLEEAGGNKNERILKRYQEGKSIIEISKELGIGQGEVKLVIDLFQGGAR